MRFLFNPITSEFNSAPPREIIYSDTAPAFPIEGTRWVNTLEIREYVFTFDANGAGYWVEVGIGSTGPQGEVGDIGPVGPVGPQGIQGVVGPAATVAVGTVTTGDAGTSVSVSNAGTSGAAVLDFTIPRGAVGQTGAVGPQGPQGIQGVKGDTGNAGPQGIQGLTGPAGPVGAVGPAGTAASVSVGTTTTGAAGTNAAVTNSGTSSAAVLNFTVPRGATGVAGPTGATGPAGTSVVLKGSVAQVANLPTTGNTAGDLYVVTATGDGYVWSGSSWSNVGPIRGPAGPAGSTGATGPAGTAASVSVGTTTTSAAGTNASVTNSGTTSAAVLNFTVPRGATGANGATGATGAVGLQGPQGIQGVKGDTGAQGPAGPAPAGTGAVVVSNGTLGTPVGYGTANVASTLVQRDASGNFSAGTITANVTGNVTGSVTGGVSGNAGTATKLATARLINVSGDVTGTAQSFDGSANITIPTAIAAGSIVNDDINAAANISDTKLATISIAGKVLNSATTATSANTANAIVTRDTNGSFSANQITANLTGTVTGNATNVSGTVAILNGGTGSTTAAGALVNLGAAAATHFHNASAINAGTLENARLPARLQATAQTITDWDNALENGWFQGNQAANAPEGVLDWWLGYVEAHGWNRWLTQTVHRFTADAPTNTHIWRRSSSDNGTARVWGAWYKLQLSQGEQDARYSLGTHTHDPSAITGTAVITTDSRLSDARTPTDGSVTTAKIADSAITSAKIADGTIVNADINASAKIADTKLATISTAGKVSNAATTATSNNTVNAIVARDVLGDFSARVINVNGLTQKIADNSADIFSISSMSAGSGHGCKVDVSHTDGMGAFIPFVSFNYANSSIGSIKRVSESSVAYTTTSDYRLKTNIEPLTAAVARLLQIPAHRFNWLADPTAPKVDGFLAHEAQAVVPESVTGSKDAVDADGKPIHQGIDQSKLVPLLVAAVQELAARVAALEAT